MTKKTKTREEFLTQAVRAMDKQILGPAGLKMPKKWAVSTSLCSTKRHAGECYPPSASADKKTTQILICPRMSDTDKALSVLLHEMIHAAVGCEHGHKKPFADACRAVGMEGKPTEAGVPKEGALADKVASIGKRLGGYPHVGLKVVSGGKDNGWIRLRSVENGEYTLVVSSKSLVNFGAPRGPNGEAMVPANRKALVAWGEAGMPGLEEAA